MCIIVCKPAGVEVPSAEIMATCFVNNPDGAGFMLAAKGAVHGYKGLMSYDEFIGELQGAEKKFGNLKKFPVVMHFRIGTHGSNVAGNTHPFPLKGGYREMRHTRWEAEQGFAHNGIIYNTSKDPDILKFNVSDTMVFAKKFVNPIAKYVSIANDKEIAEALHAVAESKLCFLDRKGRLMTCGDFVQDGGIYYSNSSYKPRTIKYPLTSRYYNSGWDYDDYSMYNDCCLGLSDHDLAEYKEELAADYGYTMLPKDTTIHTHHYSKDKNTFTSVKNVEGYFIDYSGCLYRFDPYRFDFILSYLPDEYDELVFSDDSFDYPTEDLPAFFEDEPSTEEIAPPYVIEN